MEAKESPIKLLRFVVLGMEFRFIPPSKQNKSKSPDFFFQDYAIDIDFSHSAVDEEQFFVFAKIGVNNFSKPKHGYKIFIEGGASFSIPKQADLDENITKNLKYFSSVNIVIGYLRAAINTLTASAPLGPYLLPPIDMQDLIKRKSQSPSERES